MTTENAAVVGVLPVAPVTSTSEERWAAWLAKGYAHDRAVRRRMAIALPILLAAGLTVFALFRF